MRDDLLPNSTQIPDILLHFVLPRIPKAEAACLLFIAAQTFGYGKDKDRISLSQFENGIFHRGRRISYGTGLSHPAILKALYNLAEADAIMKYRTKRGIWYAINLDMDEDEVVVKINELRELKR